MKDLKTYQQIVLYFTPMITNLGFVNIVVVVVRLRWFRQRFKDVGMLCSLRTQYRVIVSQMRSTEVEKSSA